MTGAHDYRKLTSTLQQNI